MSPLSQEGAPLVSVIIPCYNHGVYLAEAIESVRSQNHPYKEIIVVDDGSSDNTKEVASQFPEVKYVYQPNQGLSAARNTGIARSSGDYLVFLDADDWLLPGALMANLQYLINNPGLAFVSGGYKLIYVPENKVWDVTREVPADHYLRLLEGNYIGMHAAVMFSRWVFATHRYDTALRACEDYDLYLRLARDHPVQHHTGLLTVYRVHTENMSGNYILMLETALTALKRQRKSLRSKEEKTAFRSGVAHFKKYYTTKIYEKLVNRANERKSIDPKEVFALWRYSRPLYHEYRMNKKNSWERKWLHFRQRVGRKIRGLMK